jgi:hypothetical protein
MRAELVEKIRSLVEQGSAAPPVVELDDYFVGNTDEDSIAPNQIGYGRPSLADFYAVLKTSAIGRMFRPSSLASMTTGLKRRTSGRRETASTSIRRPDDPRSRAGWSASRLMVFSAAGLAAGIRLRRSRSAATMSMPSAGTDLHSPSKPV